MSEEIRIQIVVGNEEGLHARPAAQLVQALRNLNCKVRLSNNPAEEVDGKSILGVMMLGAERGARLNVRASGPDAQRAVDEISRILEDQRGAGP
ncbi:MAG: HPr family phosphocarrier protein [Candidatus Omnitrophica bacterium]|nr:Phosphocarrier protein HPr [bacterium]NUN96759.1 HPr family phosphocarrier protein [Candidatus Omnitrophota bacterium]